MYVKLIASNIFQDETKEEESESVRYGTVLGKRRKTYHPKKQIYESALDYINQTQPALKSSPYFSLLRDKKFMFKKYRRSVALNVIEAISKPLAKKMSQVNEEDDLKSPNLNTDPNLSIDQRSTRDNDSPRSSN